MNKSELDPCYCRINPLLCPRLLLLLERFNYRQQAHFHTFNGPLKTFLSYFKADLKPRVSKELVEEVHEEVNLEAADTQHHVFLRLRPVAAVVASGFLPLHPQKGQLLKLHRGRHLSHSTDGKRIRLAGIQQRPRWYMKRKTMPSVWCFHLIRESVWGQIKISGDFRSVGEWNVIVHINREKHVMEILVRLRRNGTDVIWCNRRSDGW